MPLLDLSKAYSSLSIWQSIVICSILLATATVSLVVLATGENMLFVKYYKSKLQNANRTLKRAVPIRALLAAIYDESLSQKLRNLPENAELNFWDVGERANKFLVPDAILAIICNNYVFVGQIIAKIRDESGKLGDALGWTRQFKKPWQNVIVLKKIKELNNTGEELKKFPSYFAATKKLGRGFFSLVGEDERHFNELLKGVTKEKTQTIRIKKKQESIIPEWLSDLIRSISLLKKDKNHYEREHESIVEKFFESLGYEPHNEIRYRQGRVDIMISLDSRPCIVVEVKRYWALTKDDEDVIFQAYRYALKNGARFVVLSNGDSYILFDRLKGFSIDQNYIGTFKLTQLEESSLQLVNFLQKENIANSMTPTEIMKTVLESLSN